MEIIMNTHAIFKKLLTYGFTETQADGITEAISEVKADPDLYVRKELFEVSETKIHENNSDISIMKCDIVEMKGDIVEIKGDIVEVKSRLGTVEREIGSLKLEVTKVHSRIDLLEASIDSKLATLEVRLMRSNYPLFLGIIASIIVPICLKYYG